MQQAIDMMNTDQVRAYLGSHKPDEYMLLDVRQDWEYEDYHIPGSRLVPLVDLADRLEEVDRGKPIIVYCASGGRSMAAAVLMEGMGVKNIVNMVGGMSAWQGHTAFGPMQLGMVSFTGKENPEEIIRKAYVMENNLQSFYLLRSDMAETLERIELFMELAGFEDKHKDTLFNLHVKISGDDDRLRFEQTVLSDKSDMVEGGMEIQKFLDEFGSAFDEDLGILQFATMIEAQALDYYLRCAMQAETDELKAVLQLLAREEKAHLKLLGKHMDRIGATI